MLLLSFFVYLQLKKRRKALGGISRSSKKPTLLYAFVLCYKCCFQNSMRKCRVWSRLTPQQNFLILWELEGSEESSPHPKCLQAPLCPSYSNMHQWFLVAFRGINASFFLSNWPHNFHLILVWWSSVQVLWKICTTGIQLPFKKNFLKCVYYWFWFQGKFRKMSRGLCCLCLVVVQGRRESVCAFLRFYVDVILGIWWQSAILAGKGELCLSLKA